MAQTNPNLINGGVEMKDGPKKERLGTVPAISLAIAAIIISLILFRDSIGGWFSGGFAEPYTRGDEDTLVEKMENDETFAFFLYGEDCPFCKEFMFGDSEAKSGEGVLTEGLDTHGEHDFGAYGSDEGDGFEELEDYMNNVQDKIDLNTNVASDQGDGRAKVFSGNDTKTGGTNIQHAGENDRPGIPAMFFFTDGYLQTIVLGSQTPSEMYIIQDMAAQGLIGPASAY